MEHRKAEEKGGIEKKIEADIEYCRTTERRNSCHVARELGLDEEQRATRSQFITMSEYPVFV